MGSGSNGSAIPMNGGAVRVRGGTGWALSEESESDSDSDLPELVSASTSTSSSVEVIDGTTLGHHASPVQQAGGEVVEVAAGQGTATAGAAAEGFAQALHFHANMAAIMAAMGHGPPMMSQWVDGHGGVWTTTVTPAAERGGGEADVVDVTDGEVGTVGPTAAQEGGTDVGQALGRPQRCSCIELETVAYCTGCGDPVERCTRCLRVFTRYCQCNGGPTWTQMVTALGAEIVEETVEPTVGASMEAEAGPADGIAGTASQAAAVTQAGADEAGAGVAAEVATVTTEAGGGGGDRFPPDAFVTAAGIAMMDAQSVRWKVRFAMWNYHVGRHMVPNVRTAAGTLRSTTTPNGSMGRVRKFIGRETDPARSGSTSAAVSVAQTAINRAVIVHGVEQTAVAMLEVCSARAEAQSPTADEVGQRVGGYEGEGRYG